MMLKKLHLTFSFILFYFSTTVALKAELINPSSLIKPKEVVRIQLTGLMNNDNKFKENLRSILEDIDNIIKKL